MSIRVHSMTPDPLSGFENEVQNFTLQNQQPSKCAKTKSPISALPQIKPIIYTSSDDSEGDSSDADFALLDKGRVSCVNQEQDILNYCSTVEGSEGDESISTSPTVTSDGGIGKEYIVNRILAEEKRDGKTLYLIEWDGYPIER